MESVKYPGVPPLAVCCEGMCDEVGSRACRGDYQRLSVPGYVMSFT